MFKDHLLLAHSYWEHILKPTDTAIDATCGNGKDTLKLATLLPQGTVISLDIQEMAIAHTKKLLEENSLSNVHLYLQSHADFPQEIQKETIKLIVYNLGYLPGSDKQIKTQVTSTLQSLYQALNLLLPGGTISLTCYPGHVEGKEELISILKFLETLSPLEWTVCHHRWILRKDSPEFFIIQRKLQNSIQKK